MPVLTSKISTYFKFYNQMHSSTFSKSKAKLIIFLS